MDNKDRIYIERYHSVIINNNIMTFAAIWRDLKIIILKWSKPDREKQISYDIAYMWNLKKNETNELIYNRRTNRENKLIVTKEKGG